MNDEREFFLPNLLKKEIEIIDNAWRISKIRSERQAELINNAFMYCGRAGDIKWICSEYDADTDAEKQAYYNACSCNLPVVLTGMDCYGMVMCFYFDSFNRASLSYSGMTLRGGKDIIVTPYESESLISKAFKLAEIILLRMQELMDADMKQAKEEKQ